MSDITNIMTRLLEYATEQGAHLHICPNSAPFVHLGNIKGVLQPVPGFEDYIIDLMTIKAVMSELLTPEQKAELLKNKYLDFSFTYGELGRFRASAYTQRGTHAITIHTLPFEVPDFHKIGLSAEAIQAVEIKALDNNGLIILAGGHFSGIPVTLAALVDLINRNRNCHISTIEKPIVYLHRHKKAMVIQKEIGADVKDYQTALRQIRQENPDVVALGELNQEDMLSVMELAEERLVLAHLKISSLFEASAVGILNAVEIIAHNSAQRNNLAAPFIPKPKISVIFQQMRCKNVVGVYGYGEVITWDMYKNKETPVKPIIYGRGAE